MTIKAINLKQWEKLAIKTAGAFSAPDMVRNQTIMLRDRMRRIMKQRFKTEGSFGGTKWKGLKASTLKTKPVGKTILRNKDTLFRSFTQSSISVGTVIGTGFSYRFGSDDPKAKWHQEGTDKMPARPPLSLKSQQLRGMSAAIGRTIVDGLFTRNWFDAVEKNRLFPGFRITGDGFDSVSIP